MEVRNMYDINGLEEIEEIIEKKPVEPIEPMLSIIPNQSIKPKGRKFLLAIVLVAVGATTLGVGLGAGHALARNFAPEPPEAPAAYSGVTSVRVNPLVVPINPQDPSIADIIPQVKDSVVSINVMADTNRPFQRTAPGAGSGFIFYQDEEYVYIATNHHVIENAFSITISLDDSENVTAHVVGSYAASDIAVLAVPIGELEGKGVPFTVAVLGDSDAMRMGDTVLAMGNAMGEGQTVTKGIVSALDLTITVSDPNIRDSITLNVMQTDAAVNRGNSGGPLLNHNGEVIGIVTAKLMGSQIEGMGYALPINEAKVILHELKETGTVRQPFIGIQNEEFSEFMRDLFNMPYTGVLVRGIFVDSPAHAAGLLPNDIIIRFNGERITGLTDLSAELANSRPGDEVILDVFRDGDTIQIPVILGVRTQ